MPPAPTPPAETPRAPARKEATRKDAAPREPGAKRARSPSEPAPAPAPAAPQAHAAADDPLFVASVEAALERGSASLVLLKRKLGVGYARAESLMEALVAGGILGEMTASGSRPTLITREDWERRRR